MHIRQQGRPEHPRRMRFVMLIMRVCLAAHFTGQNAETMLGPGGQLLKRAVSITHSSGCILRCFLRHTDRLVGIGGQYIVMYDAQSDQLVKYSYTLAGTDNRVLEQSVAIYTREFNNLRRQFGALVVPTTYSLAKPPLRWPFGVLNTLCARQPLLCGYTDIFSPEAEALLQADSGQLRKDIAELARRTRAWTMHNKWLDIIGPCNVVMAAQHGQVRVRIIDTEPYVAEYLKEVNPVIGKPYREVFADKLRAIEMLAGAAGALLAIIVLPMVHPWHIASINGYELLEDTTDILVRIR